MSARRSVRLLPRVKRALIPAGLVLGSFNQHAPRPPVLCAQGGPEPGERLPEIGITTPSFGHARFIGRTIDSVLSQRYPSLRYHVQDGGSTDGTVGILEQTAARLRAAGRDDGFTFASEPDSGQTQAINRGLTRVGGEGTEIMAWVNSDDLYLPGALLAVGRYFRDHPSVDVVYGHRVVLDPSGLEVGRWVMPRFARAAAEWRCYVPQETMFWRRSIWDRVGGRLDESFQFAMDWELVARFFRAGARFHRLPMFLGGFTTHPEQKSLAIRETVGEPEFARVRAMLVSSGAQRTRARAESLVYLARSVPAFWRWRLLGRA